MHTTFGADCKSRIARRQPFVEQQNVRVDCSSERKAQACHHAGRVGSNRQLEILT